MKGKSLIGVILAAICVTVTYLLPGSEELSHEGITALGVLGMASILWISNTLPFGVTGLLALVMLVLLGVSDMASVFVGFSNSSVIFVITVFCLTAAVMNTKLTLRLINKLLRWAGSSAEKLVLAYMAAAALLSSVMSNVPVTVLFLGLAQPVLKAVGAKPGSSRLGKCLMIGIPFAAVNGGMATPAGSSFNVLAMGVFESIAGKPLTFLQWMAVGLPTAIVATLVCWICLVKIFKPEAINEECSASIREEAENAGKISAYEKKVLFMLVAMPVLWILGTWFPALDVTVVSIIGFVVMFMPGINILTWKQFEESVPWNIILMFGAILSLGTIVAKTGGAAYLSKLFLASGVMNLNIILVFFIVGVFAYLLQTFFPVAPAIISLFVPAVAAVCVPMGISAAVPTLIITIVAAGTYLLPINPISALSFDYGYYSSADMAKAGLIPSVALCAFVAVWTPLIIRIRKANEKLGCDFYQLFGMSEMGPVITLLRAEDHRAKDDALLEKRLKSVGKVALGAKIKIVAPDGSKCPVGRQGEIYAQGLGQMMCYYNAPDKTASVFSDGWYHTGDVGYLDEDNYLYLVGRMSDMIISGGENVYPKSVEECILALDGVENVAVVGLKDDHLGEAVTAVIVKAPGAELDEATVRNWCKGKIAGFMKPRKVFFVNELPVNSTGKIDKRKLTEMFN